MKTEKLKNVPTEKEWKELYNIYHHLTEIAKELNQIRIKLYTNHAHRYLNENWQTLDDILYHIQSEIWTNENDSFGSWELEQLVK